MIGGRLNGMTMAAGKVGNTALRWSSTPQTLVA
jgi:hypothetical protein